MNTQFNIVFSLKNGGTQNAPILITENLFVSPFYASIRDIELAFHESVVFSDRFYGKLNEIIFNKSIFIDAYLRNKRIRGLTKEDLFIIKRDYVICATIYEAAKHIYINTLKSSTVKKQLGDFIVERSSSIDNGGIKKISDDAEKCMKDILAELDAMVLFFAEAFIKGSALCSSLRADRLWHHPDYLSRVPIAADKFLEADGRFYKTGAEHVHQYGTVRS